MDVTALRESLALSVLKAKKETQVYLNCNFTFGVLCGHLSVHLTAKCPENLELIKGFQGQKGEKGGMGLKGETGEKGEPGLQGLEVS